MGGGKGKPKRKEKDDTFPFRSFFVPAIEPCSSTKELSHFSPNHRTHDLFFHNKKELLSLLVLINKLSALILEPFRTWSKAIIHEKINIASQPLNIMFLKLSVCLGVKIRISFFSGDIFIELLHSPVLFSLETDFR